MYIYVLRIEKNRLPVSAIFILIEEEPKREIEKKKSTKRMKQYESENNQARDRASQ